VLAAGQRAITSALELSPAGTLPETGRAASETHPCLAIAGPGLPGASGFIPCRSRRVGIKKGILVLNTTHISCAWNRTNIEIHQLKTFVAVAREGSITRASDLLALSQPAVSAHIKAIEDILGITLFERTTRGMSLTGHGQRLLRKAMQALSSHRELLDEAARIKGCPAGTLRLGVGGDSSIGELTGQLLLGFAERYPEVEISLQHGSSLEILTGIRSGSLDAGFYNESREPYAELVTFEVARFYIYLVAASGLVSPSQARNWEALRELPWLYSVPSLCCGRAAEELFKTHDIRPKRIIDVDRESVRRSLLAEKLGVGLVHAADLQEAEFSGCLDILCEVQRPVRVLFAYLASREHDPLLSAVNSIVHAA